MKTRIRPFARRLMFTLALTGLILLLAAWITSLRYHAELVAARGLPFYSRAQLARGQLVIDILTPEPDGSRSGWANTGLHVQPATSPWPQWSFRRQKFPTELIITIPLWPAILVFAFTTRWSWRTIRREPTPGRCPRCRYDLSGLPPASPCPECGPLLHRSLRVLLQLCGRSAWREKTG